jgi:hypothetical protein
VKRLVLCTITMLLLVACETSTDPLGGFLGGGGAITRTQAAGNWSFTVRRSTTLPACTNPLADGSVVTAHLDVLADGTLATASSTWLNPISGAVQPLSGSVNLANGASILDFAAPAVNANAQMEITGTMTASGGLTGTLRDPGPGSFQVFGTGGCEYSVAGQKTS